MAVAIVDYQMNNIRSVQKAFESQGFSTRVVTRPEEIAEHDRIVLPGVGAFGQAIEQLQSIGVAPALRDAARAGKQVLGVCLGMQLLFDRSEEFGLHEGLGLLPGVCQRLPAGVRVPHVGWNQVQLSAKSPLLEGVPDGQYFYFVHSYFVEPQQSDMTLATTDYGRRFASIVGAGNVWGVQFHPEKSQRWGLQILKNFAMLTDH